MDKHLVARPSRDLLVAAHQHITQEWWAGRRSEFSCWVSQVVIDEASAGDAEEVRKRLVVLADLPAIEVIADAEAVTQAILAAGVIPPRAIRDAAHVGVAAVHGIDYLLTWNCAHLANAQIMGKISLVVTGLGRRMPVICTPEELMGE